MTRRRMTWNERKASAPPATPGYLEGTEHPAYGQEDPDADQYMNGDPSSWAEDPTVGPYPNPAPPATPGTESPQGHPATDPKHYFPAGAGKSASRNLRAAMEHKASKCIRIATRMLGRKASVDAIEDQALDLMNLSDRQIQAMLTRIAEEGPEANYTLTEPRTSGDLLADDLMIEDEDVIVPASEDEDLEAEALFAEMVEGAKFAKKSEDTDVEAEELLAEMEKEEKKASLRNRAAKKSEDEAKPEVKEDATEEDAAKKAAHFKRLASFWAKKAGEEVEETEEVEEKESAKKASLRRRADQNAPNADEAKLAEMLEEESKKAAKKSEGEEPDGDEATAEEEALLADMEKEESKKAAKKSEDAEEVEESEESDEEEKAEDGEDEGADKKAFDETFLGDSFDSDLGDPMMEEDLFVDDPMALMDDAGVSDDEMALLYGSKFAKVKSAKKSEDEAEEVKEEEPKEEAKTAAARTAAAKRTAALKPQPRLASTGVKTLGSVSKTASNEVNDLSKLWESAPDVSKIFGN